MRKSDLLAEVTDVLSEGVSQYLWLLLEDRRSVGASCCNSRDGTDQKVQSLMFVMHIGLRIKYLFFSDFDVT